MKKTHLLLISVVISLSSCGVLTPITSDTQNELVSYPKCQEEINELNALNRLAGNINNIANECILIEKDKRNREILWKEQMAVVSEFPACEGYFVGAGGNHASGMQCAERHRINAEKEKVRVEKRKLYFESPEGKAEIELNKKNENRIMSICDKAGRDIEAKYHVGIYDGTVSRNQISAELYYCVAIYNKKTITGYIQQIFKGITVNNASGVYEFQNLR